MFMGDQLHAIEVNPAALRLGARHVREAAPVETGGILLGWREGMRIVVDTFLEVPDCSSSSHSYERRHHLASRELEARLADGEETFVGYVGEWHSHPSRSPASARDLSSLRAIAGQLQQPVALIVLMLDADSTVVCDAHVARRRPFLGPKVLPGRVSFVSTEGQSNV
jgi:proteasome lid subunit RPN8/RPN11